MTVTVVTANYGGHDLAPPLPPPQQDVPTRWIYYSDTEIEVPRPWQLIIVEPRFPSSANLSAKVYKTTPTGVDTDVIWIDANMEIKSPTFAREALAARHDGVAAFAHPRRDCIYAEADAALGHESQDGKYEMYRLKIASQMRTYLADGYPVHGGLFACGVIAWDFADERAEAFGSAWLTECVRWSPQDQLSFPVVARKLGVEPGVFPLDQLDRRYRTRVPWSVGNRWLSIHAHAPAAVPS